jgi:hypothetical protein
MKQGTGLVDAVEATGESGRLHTAGTGEFLLGWDVLGGVGKRQAILVILVACRINVGVRSTSHSFEKDGFWEAFEDEWTNRRGETIHGVPLIARAPGDDLCSSPLTPGNRGNRVINTL